MSDPLIPVLRGNNILSWPKNGAGGVARYTPVSEVLTTNYRTDAHFAQYSNPEIERRLGKEFLDVKRQDAYCMPVRMVAMGFDCDTPGHVNVTEDWMLAERLNIERLRTEHLDVFVFFTRRGYRIFVLLPEPFLIGTADDAAKWTAFYLQSVAYLKRVFGIRCDPLGDWQHIFRAPHATRDEGGQPEHLLTIGDPETIGTWVPVISAADIEVAKTLTRKAPKKSKARKTSDPVNCNGIGVIGQLLQEDNLMVREVEPSVWDIICPDDNEHTTGSKGDNRVRYYAPTSLGQYLGTIDDFHKGSGHDLRTSKDWLKCWPQSRIDAAREAQGLPPWNPPQAKTTTVKSEGPKVPIDFDELEGDEHGPDGVPVDEDEKVDLHWGGPTDLGNAERLVAMFGESLHYCYPKKKWLVWTGTVWQWDDGGTVQRMAKEMARSLYQVAIDCQNDDDKRKRLFKWACESEGNARITSAIALAQSERGIPVQPAELDADPMLFNVANGTIDLHDGSLRAHRRQDLCTRIANVTYKPGATSKLWSTFLTTATGGDESLALYLQRACGYAMQGSVSEKHFWIVFGGTDTSKTTLIGAISKAFGGYHESADASTWLVQNSVGGNRGDMVRLMGARLVTSSEFPQNAKWDESVIKKITGADLLTYAAKYEADVTFAPTFALWCACNDAPRIHDDDAGMWARAQRLPFNHQIAKADQDKHLAKKLAAPEVLSAILTWCVQGCIDWQRDGLPECAAVDASVMAYRAENDRCLGFLNDCLEFADPFRCNAGKLRESYEAWCRDAGIKHPMTTVELAKRLEEKGAIQSRARSQGGKYWKGFRLAIDGPEDSKGALGALGDPLHRKTSHENSNGILSGNSDTHSTHSTPNDILDREEWEAEHSWRTTQ